MTTMRSAPAVTSVPAMPMAPRALGSTATVGAALRASARAMDPARSATPGRRRSGRRPPPRGRPRPRPARMSPACRTPAPAPVASKTMRLARSRRGAGSRWRRQGPRPSRCPLSNGPCIARQDGGTEGGEPMARRQAERGGSARDGDRPRDLGGGGPRGGGAGVRSTPGAPTSKPVSPLRRVRRRGGAPPTRPSPPIGHGGVHAAVDGPLRGHRSGRERPDEVAATAPWSIDRPSGGTVG